jgi:hypothetical protein
MGKTSLGVKEISREEKTSFLAWPVHKREAKKNWPGTQKTKPGKEILLKRCLIGSSGG